MSTERTPKPGACAVCGGTSVREHCASPTCSWVICGFCNAITAIVHGRPQAMPDKRLK